MDILASLNIDELPEQQTRMMHLMDEHPDFEFKLGFDACCTCGKGLESVIICRGCKRVRYCSEDCLQEDATFISPSVTQENDEESERAMGHTSVICTLLQTCNDDEDVEDEIEMNITASRRQAALDRIRSEYESYPATLANAITTGTCYQEELKRCVSQKLLVLHVIGASFDAELSTSNKDENEDNKVFLDYAEALSNLTSVHKDIHKIELFFIGPDCPETNMTYTTPIASSDATLFVRTLKGIYNQDLFKQFNISQPNIVVFFNPGFTVPEYENWKTTLALLRNGTPFLSTTNTGKCNLVEQFEWES